MDSEDQQQPREGSNNYHQYNGVSSGDEASGVDQVDSGIGSEDHDFREQREEPHYVAFGSTQTDEFDCADGCGRYSVVGGRLQLNNVAGTSSSNGGLFSNLMTMMLPVKRIFVDRTVNASDGSSFPNLGQRCVATQTEESPASVKAHDLCTFLIQELALGIPVDSSYRDEVLDALCYCVSEILEKHEILFNGMLRRFEVSDYRVFTSIANELFEASTDPSNFRITWGRIVSLFAFAVRLAQNYQESHDDEMIDNVIHYLSNYVSKHLLDFVEDNGGWEGLVIQFPLPYAEHRHMKRAMLWSALGVGLVATMCVSSFLSK